MEMNATKTILLAFVTSATTVGLLTFVLKYFLQRHLDLYFMPKEHQHQLEYDKQKRISEKVIDERVGIYPQLLSITYRLRVMLENGISEPAAILWSHDIRELCYHLTESLFQSRAFLSETAFKPLHEFKHLCQDIVVELDILTREDAINDEEAYAAAIPRLKNKVNRVQKLYPEIRDELTLRTCGE